MIQRKEQKEIGESICIITEANKHIATGHLAESCALARGLYDIGYDVNFFVNDSATPRLINNIPIKKYKKYTLLEADIDQIIRFTNENESKVIVTNLRKIDNDVIKFIKTRSTASVICIDELGHRCLDSDVIINPLIDSYYYDYTKECKAKKYFGPQYLIMKPEFSILNKKEKVVGKNIRVITICMGGSDKYGCTMKIMSALDSMDFKGMLNVIIGGGFLYNEELQTAIASYSNKNVMLYQNIPYVYDVFNDSDIAFCSGGNVLFELACLGVPALTIYGELHEKSNAEGFYKRGFGICVGQAEKVNEFEIIEATNGYSSYDLRIQHSANGKKIIDGSSINRIIKIICDLIADKQ